MNNMLPKAVREGKVLKIALIGMPNVGKSTLVNNLVKEKISIVSPKPQTTVKSTLGVISQENTQLIFYDTPGWFNKHQTLKQKNLATEVLTGMDRSDVVCLLIESHRMEDFSMDHPNWSELKNLNKPLILILTKTDLVKPKEELLKTIAKIDTSNFERVFLISALRGQGTKDINQYLISKAMDGVWEFDDNSMTNQSARVLAQEFTREQVFLLTNQEVPYRVQVNTIKWQEDDKSIKIFQEIIVPRDSQKPIVIGKNGEKIKLIGSRSRLGLTALLKKNVHLFLEVRVAPELINKT